MALILRKGPEYQRRLALSQTFKKWFKNSQEVNTNSTTTTTTNNNNNNSLGNLVNFGLLEKNWKKAKSLMNTKTLLENWKKAVEYEDDTSCNRSAQYSRQIIFKGTGGIGNKRTSGDDSNYNII